MFESLGLVSRLLPDTLAEGVKHHCDRTRVRDFLICGTILERTDRESGVARSGPLLNAVPGRGLMYRSVQPSERETRSGAKRVLYWCEGIAVGIVVFIGISFLLGLLSY